MNVVVFALLIYGGPCMFQVSGLTINLGFDYQLGKV